MLITKISFSRLVQRAETQVDATEFQKSFAVARQSRKPQTDAAPAAPTANAVLLPRDNFSLRQQAFRIATPVLTDAPDPDGRTGSYRRAVLGIDPTIPGNPGYADYAGLGGTAAAEEQTERNRLANSLRPNFLRA